jgi:hypothetical protein
VWTPGGRRHVADGKAHSVRFPVTQPHFDGFRPAHRYDPTERDGDGDADRHSEPGILARVRLSPNDRRECE